MEPVVVASFTYREYKIIVTIVTKYQVKMSALQEPAYSFIK